VNDMPPTSIPDDVPPGRLVALEWFGGSFEPADLNAMLYERFRDKPEVMYIPPNVRSPAGAWLFTRQQHIRRALSDTEYFTSRHIAGFNLMTGSDDLLIPVEYDPPEHAQYRKIINPSFTREAIGALDGEMRKTAVQAIDTIAGDIARTGASDAVPLCHMMMMRVWCTLMGAPVDEGDRYLSFLMRMLHTYDPAERGRCAMDMLEAMRSLYQMHKGKTAPGLINTFVNGSIQGRPVTETEAAGFILFMFLAGVDTVGSTTAWSLFHLARHPEQQLALSENPELIPAFIEEILRRYAIVSTNRFVTKDLEIDGVMLKAGDNVLVSLPLACMDDRAFGCPVEMTPDRPERHMAFGFGAHFCVGANLARAQLQIFFEEWLRRVPAFRIQDGAKTTAHLGEVAALDSLYLTW
jgi:cytochrome P450